MQHFKFAVIGKGMMGAAAAKYLAQQSDGVVLIGPDEPEDKKNHPGVFASHYDEGRITRTIDPDANWARLANRSIARYREIEAQSGISFYTEAGCLLTGPKRGGADHYISHVVDAAKALSVHAPVYDNAGLENLFPFFAFPDQTEGVFEPSGAGHVSPRRLVKAQTILAEKAGATVLRQEATGLVSGETSVRITLANGDEVSADTVLVAAGGFTNGTPLLPQKIELLVFARTITYFEVSQAEARRLAKMPSLITKPENAEDSIYMLPPIQYPDGKFYAKIGGEPVDLPVATDREMRTWFRTDGLASVREHQIERMKELVPSLDILGITSGSCVTSYTPSTYPMIGFSRDPKLAVLAGCGGASAKSSDEIGRLGAELMLHGRINDPDYTTDFKPDFRNR